MQRGLESVIVILSVRPGIELGLKAQRATHLTTGTARLITLFIGIQNSGLALNTGWKSQLMRNLPNPSRLYSKPQTRVEEIEKCLDQGLEPTYNFSIFS